MASVNIVLFGETGVGKSSVINLIAGHQVASVSPDAEGRTLTSKRYSFPVGDRAFHIWDTAGLEQPEMGAVEYMAAIEGVLSLIQQLAAQGGLDLLLFCIRGNRITATTQSNYRLFYEVLCKSQVPIALVITNLEREKDMEGWWTRNLSGLEKYGIKAAGHACVTGLPKHSKYPESKANMERMLRGYDGEGKYVMPPDSWFTDFLRLFGLFAPPKKDLKKRELLKVLTKRCKLNPRIAQEIAERLTSTRM
ncbi:P-loop containing nucleoside triphosphate hydrolase protein [Tylopilus felleus]